MAGEYAPSAIVTCYNDLRLPSKVLSGIRGDSAHTYGYHRCRLVVPSNDYSCQYTLDRQGDGWACSALDISLSPTEMRSVTAALIAGLKAGDKRLRAVRECFGTVNGLVVTGWDAAAGGPTSSDASHLWHVHISFYRAYANDVAAMRDVAAFINAVVVDGKTPQGGTAVPIEEDDLPYSKAELTTIIQDAVKSMRVKQPANSPAQPFELVLLDVFQHARAGASQTTPDKLREAVASTPIKQVGGVDQPLTLVLREVHNNSRKVGSISDDVLARLAATVASLIPAGSAGVDTDELAAHVLAGLVELLAKTPITLGGAQ